MEKNKKNKILLICIIGVIGLIAFTGIIYHFNKEKNELNFGVININSNQLKDITDNLPDGTFQICNFDNQCSIFRKVNLNGN